MAMGDEVVEAARSQFAAHCERFYLSAMLALAERAQLAGPAASLDDRRRAADAAIAELAARADLPMARVAAQLELTEAQRDLLWAAAALAGDPRLVVHAEALGGPAARRGLSVALYGEITGVDAEIARSLTAWLATGNPLVDLGLLVPVDDAGTAAARPYLLPPRLLAHLRGDDALPEGLRMVAPSGDAVIHDDAQTRTLAQLAGALRPWSEPMVVVVEGAQGSGRSTAAALAAGRDLVVLALAPGDRPRLEAALLGLRREACLTRAIPAIADADLLGDGSADVLAAFLDRTTGPVVLTTTTAGLALRTRRPVMRTRWPIAGPGARRRLWERAAQRPAGPPRGDLDLLAVRYAVGPGAIARAVESARAEAAEDAPLDAERLAAGLRHNIAEKLGSLARRVDVTQTWDELIVADDTRAQINALVARVRHAPKVLDGWGFRAKMARGAGVAALFSGPPGTGKSMCAGLVARELELEMYQVDLSQVVSKWVGETEKQLGQVFDAAEEGHALLLFDEADALFGQRSADIKGANDRYANLEVNYLLQRIEAFGGITILTTNLDTTIDRALKRRLAAHIVFDAPDEDERAALWQRLATTSAAPMAKHLDFEELARSFPSMTGANIRNAALSAAFLAAAEGAATITGDHLGRAARAEYRAMGYVLAERSRGGSPRGL